MTLGKLRIFLVSFFVFSLLFASCNEEEQPPISVEKMAALVMDLQAAENYSIGKFPENDSNFGKAVKNLDTLAFYYNAVFKHHNTDLEEFTGYMDWYVIHSQKLEHVYLAIADTMQRFKLADDSLQVPIIVNEPLAVPDQPSAPTAFPNLPQDSSFKANPLNRPARVEVMEDDYEQQTREEIKQKSRNLRESLEEVKQQNK